MGTAASLEVHRAGGLPSAEHLPVSSLGLSAPIPHLSAPPEAQGKGKSGNEAQRPAGRER